MPDVKDIQTAAPEAVQTQETPSLSPKPTVKKPGGKGRKKMIKRLIALAVIAALVGGTGFGMWYLVFREDKAASKPLTDMAGINTIQSVVQGYGNAVPKESAGRSTPATRCTPSTARPPGTTCRRLRRR